MHSYNLGINKPKIWDLDGRAVKGLKNTIHLTCTGAGSNINRPKTLYSQSLTKSAQTRFNPDSCNARTSKN